MSARLSLAFYLFINSYIGKNHSYLGKHIVYPPKKSPKTKLTFFSTKISTSLKGTKNSYQGRRILGYFLPINCSKFIFKNVWKALELPKSQRN